MDSFMERYIEMWREWWVDYVRKEETIRKKIEARERRENDDEGPSKRCKLLTSEGEERKRPKKEQDEGPPKKVYKT